MIGRRQWFNPALADPVAEGFFMECAMTKIQRLNHIIVETRRSVAPRPVAQIDRPRITGTLKLKLA